ncbi:MAG: hypothetical protein QXY39_07255 [Thermofilaceae archaeon]
MDGIGFVPKGATVLGLRLVGGDGRVLAAPGGLVEGGSRLRVPVVGRVVSWQEGNLGLGLGGLPKVTLRVPCEPLGLGEGELELVVLASDVRDPRTGERRWLVWRA